MLKSNVYTLKIKNKMKQNETKINLNWKSKIKKNEIKINLIKSEMKTAPKKNENCNEKKVKSNFAWA